MTQNQIDGARQIRDRSIPAIKLADGALTESNRTQAVLTTTTLDPGTTGTGVIGLSSGFRALRLDTSHPARVRLYTTAAKLAADAARDIGEDPEGDHGLILEYVTTAGVLSADLSPVVDGYSMADPVEADIPAAVTNLHTSAATVVVTITHIVTEA